MKYRILFASAITSVFFTALVLLLICCESDASQIRDGVLRLHIVANSDSEGDQKNKIAVRDGLASLCSELFYGARTKSEAVESARLNSELLENAAREILLENGCEDSVSVAVCRRFFPTREYDGVSLPAGVYDAVDVRLGKAEGKNFWCVMFPDICVGASDSESNREKMSDVLSGGALELTTDSEKPAVRLKFKVVEIFENIKHLFKA